MTESRNRTDIPPPSALRLEFLVRNRQLPLHLARIHNTTVQQGPLLVSTPRPTRSRARLLPIIGGRQHCHCGGRTRCPDPAFQYAKPCGTELGKCSAWSAHSSSGLCGHVRETGIPCTFPYIEYEKRYHFPRVSQREQGAVRPRHRL
jgi:hypothetical protein